MAPRTARWALVSTPTATTCRLPVDGRQGVASGGTRRATVGVLLALLLLGAGVVGVRDGAVGAGWLHGAYWTRSAAQHIDGLTPQVWMIPVGVGPRPGGCVVGARRPETPPPHRSGPASPQCGVDTPPRPGPPARRHRRAGTRGHPHLRLGQPPARVGHRGHTSTTAVRAEVTDAVTDRLAALASAPRVKVTARTRGGSA